MPATQAVRTFIAAIVGTLIVHLIGILPTVADVLAWIDGIFTEAGYPGLSALALVQAAVTALVILAYQRVAQWLGDRWPKIEAIMLGSAKRPTYTAKHGN